MAKTYHPDKDMSNEEKFREVLQAYHILSDDARKSEYDRKLNGEKSGSGSSE